MPTLKPIPRRSPTADLARGFGSLVSAALLLIGVPWVLAEAVGWPLPRGVPSPGEVTQALGDGYLPDGTLVKALALVVWLIWAQLVIAFVVEAIAVARGRHASGVPVPASIHRLAGRLIAGITLLGVLSATRGVPVPLPIDRPASSAVTPPVVQVDDAKPPVPVAVVEHPVYEVQRHDTLWDIAESQLGDPFRWPEIYQLNCDVEQPDGSRLVDADLIMPGWQFRLPLDAAAAATPAAAPAPAPAPAPEETKPQVIEAMVGTEATGDVLVRLPDQDPAGTVVVTLDAEPVAADLDVLERLPDAPPVPGTPATPDP